MPNEISQTINFAASKNGATVSINSTKRIDMSGNELLQNTQLIGTTAETISLGDIAGAPAQVCVKNLDATNFVEIGGDSGLTVLKLRVLPGEASLFRPTSGTLYGKADTAAVRIQVVAAEA